MMAQRSNLRLVHCPKCANLLQEPHGCSVFKCGACGAILKAKKREPTSDGGNLVETSKSFGDAREHERESCDRNVKYERLLSSGARADDSISNSAMEKREESACTRRDNVRDDSTGLRLDRRRAKEETAYAFDYKQYREDRVNKLVETGFGENSPRFKKVLDLANSQAERGGQSFAGDHFEGFLRDSRNVTKHVRTCRYSYPEEGPSNHYRSPSFGYGEYFGSRDDVTDRGRVRQLERERVELLRKLDELGNLINQSSDMANEPGAGETVPRHKRIASGDRYYARAGYDNLDEPLVREGSIRKPPDARQGRESARSMESYEMEMSNHYFSPRDGQVNLLQNPQRPFWPGTMRPFCQYAHEPPHGCLAEGYMGFDRDPLVMYPNQSPHHHPSCTCSSCYYKYERVPPPQFLPNASSSSKTFEGLLDSNLYHRVNSVKIRPQHTRQSGDSTSSSNSKYLHPLQMWVEDADLDIESFARSQPKRSMVSHWKKKRCHPIAGAAPFITCLKCLELLKLPKELVIKEKSDKQKLRCSGCSVTILFEIENKKLVTSIKEGSSGGAAKNGGVHIQISSTCSDSGGVNSNAHPSATKTSSDPYDGSSKWRKITGDNSLLELQPQNASDSGKMQGVHSPASSSPSVHSEVEESPDSVIAQCNARSEYNTSPKPQNSHVPEQFDNLSSNGNENSRMSQEGVSLEKNDTCQSRREDASATTEVEISLSEYPHTGLSFLEVQPQNASNSGKMQGLHSPTSSSPSLRSEEEENADSVIAQRNARSEYNASPKLQYSHIPEHFDNPSTNRNENSRMNQEGVSLEKNDTCQSTREDASTTTEVEVPLNEYPHTGLSFLEVQPQNASDSGNMQGLHSPVFSSPSFHSEEEENADSMIAHSNVLTRSKNSTSPKLQNSHVPKHFDNSSSYENEKSRMNQKGVSVEKNDACQSTGNDAIATAEVEVPLNDYPHTELSQHSKDTGKEAKEKVNKRSKYYLGGLIRNYGEFQNLENEKPNVTVNGHLIPDDIVKRAEKLAGPVLPGDYWYDFQAGFWGVMSQPCLGIIPPFIEEFKHPMPSNCAAGNTRIFMNGRELNQRDLDLLASRGLPRTRNRFYAIDISGIVLDEKTHEVLYNLGKLAPTVERLQHGFGMRVPEVA